METDPQIEVQVHLQECANALSEVEAEFVHLCCLADPRLSFKAFAEKHGLSQKAMADLRVRAMDNLRGKLAEKNIRCLTDIL